MSKENNAISKKRLPELDMLRGFAMLSAVSIHAANMLISGLTGSRWHLPAFLLQCALNYAVPVFMLISALLTALNDSGASSSILVYYKKKLIRLLLPYLAWSLFYIALRLVMHSLKLSEIFSWRNWFYWISQGRAYEHLYYIVVLIQFHIIYPFLIKLARLVKDSPVAAFIITIGGQNIVYWLNKLWLYRTFPYFHSSIFEYFGIVFIGLYLGLNYVKVLPWLKKNIIWLSASCLISAVVYIYFRYMIYAKIHLHTYPYSFTRLFYVISLPICLLVPAYYSKLKHIWCGRCLIWIGKYTMGIYMAHPVITAILRKYIKPGNAISLSLLCVATVIISVAVCGYASKYLEKYKLTAWIVGAAGKSM